MPINSNLAIDIVYLDESGFQKSMPIPKINEDA